MPSLPDGIVIFIIALLLFGPKKLPVLARELGKWIGEFRRASNEFKMQMEEELRLSEQADRQKTIAAMEAAAPVAPTLEGVPTDEPEHPHTPTPDAAGPEPLVPAPLPIAVSGDLSIMPPSTGLPTARTTHDTVASDLGPLFESIPTADQPPTPATTESPAHG